MEDEKKKKICFASSSGGHFDELMALRPLMDEYDSFVVTEKTAYQVDARGVRAYYMLQVNRREASCLFRLLVNAFRALRICAKERPDVIISTGVLAVIPMCLICKLFGKKLIYIESVANVTRLSKSGKLLLPFADQFYVQWPGLAEMYPKAIYLGRLY